MTGTDKRFSETLNDPKCQLAELVHPMFKLDWVDDVAFESTLTDLLKRHLTASVRSESPSATAAATSDHESPTSAKPSSSFFAQLSARRQTRTTVFRVVSYAGSHPISTEERSPFGVVLTNQPYSF